jgi:ferritin-like metal-binding protein YciE
MAEELRARDAKLIQYLNEAYGKERELETALQAHIAMTTRAPYKKRLQEHLRETKAQAKGLERRIKALGGKAEAMNLPGPEAASRAASAATAAASKAVSAAKGPLHMLRGTGEAEKLLKNAKTELWNEFEEIGNYIAIESLAGVLNDKETVKLAKEFRRQEERMAKFLQGLIPTLTKAVATEEIPAAERRNGASTTRRRSTTGRRTSGAASSRSGGSRSGTSRSGASRSSSSRSSASSRSSSSRAGSSRSASSGRSGGSTRSGGSSGRSGSGSSRSSSRSSGSSSRSSGSRSRRTSGGSTG